MKNYLLLFILIFSVSLSQAQTLQNPTFGNATSNTLTLKSNIESVSSSNKIQVQETDGKVNYLQSINIPIPFTPVNYAPSTPTLGAHLGAIDTRLGQIGNTTAGITNRIFFTGDNVTVSAGTFFASNGIGKGTATSGLPTPLVNTDNQKQYFNKDLLSIAQPSATTAPPGVYSGQLTVSSTPTPNGTFQRYTVEIYKTNNGGTPIASGIVGAPTGNLGVTVVAILDSGQINLVAGAITNIGVSGTLLTTLSLATGERLRYHVSAQKVGTGGGNVTMSVLYGSDYNSYYDVTVSQKASTVINDSGVSGVNIANSLDNLNTLKANDTNVIHTTGNETKSGILNMTDKVQFGTSKTTYGQAIGVSKTITSLDKHIFDDYSILNPSIEGDGFGVFDASTEMQGSVNNNHFMAYQSRLLYTSSGNLTDDYGLTGLFVFNSHLGTGVIANAHGILIEDVGGDLGLNGAITNNYGIKLKEIKRGVNNFAIDSDGGDLRIKGDIYNRNGKGFYSYSQGYGADADTRYSSFLNDGNTHFYTSGKGAFQAGDFLFSSYQDATQKDHFLIKSNNGNIGIGTLTPTNYGTLKTVSINGATGSLIEFKINDIFKGYVSFDANSMDLFNSNNTPIKFITNSVERGSFNGSGVFKINNLSGTQTEIVVTDLNGNLSKGGAAPTSGTYTPTLSIVSNASAFTLVSAIYSIIGNLVTVRLDLSIDPISINTQVNLTATLPVNMSSAAQTTLGSGTFVATTDFLPVTVSKSSTSLVNVTFKTLTDINLGSCAVTFSYLK